ncbi:MAG: GTP-binding protein [Marinobacter sp.]|uniref:CobW family GTP-binding protein n=1 Tax=Marinobacter sp. TaxID=50741 RepID=UPI00299E2B9D|nr:GTP-binding protein [Marinobacter sp.]MDX1754684.1 GTP-binding protein [Marinobacter sp.]
MKQPIPTNLILGFLGVGKTTAILHLLKHKPADETWAVLVNEFGEVGIDGTLLADQGAVVREVPGGCMCCVAGLPMQIGLNRLIHQAQPDRLLIEPTGLGHPTQIIETLTHEHYREVLALGPVIGLVDPRRLTDPRVLENEQFQDQAAAADVLVANKTDLCSAEELERFTAWAQAFSPAKTAIHRTRHGQLAPDWLQGQPASTLPSAPQSHRHDHHHDDPPESPASIEEQPWQRVNNQGLDHFSLGWRLHPSFRFPERELMALVQGAGFLRVKGVVHTQAGWRAINLSDGVLSVTPVEDRDASRLEIISPEPLAADTLDQQLRQLAHWPD